MNMKERARNLEVYERLKPEFSQHRGEYVAISRGRLVLYAQDFKEAFQLVKDDPYAIVCEVGDAPRVTPVKIGWHR